MVDMQKLPKTDEKSTVIFMGIPASGKSTFYRKYFSDTHVHINLDTLHTRNKEKLLLDQCIADGSSFVVDNTNPTVSDRERYVPLAKAAGCRIYGYLFRGNISECVKRNENRTGKARVSDRAITAISAKMELPSAAEGFDEIYFVNQTDGDFEILEYKPD